MIRSSAARFPWECGPSSLSILHGTARSRARSGTPLRRSITGRISTQKLRTLSPFRQITHHAGKRCSQRRGLCGNLSGDHLLASQRWPPARCHFPVHALKQPRIYSLFARSLRGKRAGAARPARRNRGTKGSAYPGCDCQPRAGHALPPRSCFE
jgi:hypothetical protein